MASVETKPMITYEKAQNAIDKYCPSELEIEYDDILVLIDDTIFGSGKVGLLATKDYICGKEDFNPPFYFDTNDVTKIEFKKAFLGGTNVLINGDKVMNLKIEYSALSISGDALLRMIFKEKDKDDKYEEDEDIDEEYLDNEDEYEEEDEEENEEYKLQMQSELNEQEIQLWNIIQQDEFIQLLKTSIAINKGFGAAAVAADLFSNFVLKIDTNFSSKSSEQELKDDVKKGVIKITSLLRNNVDKLGLYQLQNDVATIEFIFYASFLIHKEFVDRGFPKEPSFELIRMAIFDIFGQNTRYHLPIVKEICMDIDSHEEASFNFLMRLYLTNKVGYTLPFDFTEKVNMNKIALSIKAYATNKGFADEIDNLFTGIMKCMNDCGVVDIIDENIINEAYKCVNELCKK